VTVTDDASVDGAPRSFSRTLTVTVNAVNDPPSFNKGGDQSVQAFVPTTLQTVPACATAISDGDAGTQSLTFNDTNNNPSLFTKPPAIASNGTLTCRPSGATGTATVSVSLRDDTSMNGTPALTSPVQTFTITVTPLSPPEIAVEQPS